MALIGATNQQRVKILEEVNETNANKLDENKNIIKQWLEMQPHLPKNYGKFFRNKSEILYVENSFVFRTPIARERNRFSIAVESKLYNLFRAQIIPVMLITRKLILRYRDVMRVIPFFFWINCRLEEVWKTGRGANRKQD